MNNGEPDALQAVINDNAAMRKAGHELAIAAIRVATTYDGVHRLLIATANWCQAVANEGERDKRAEDESPAKLAAELLSLQKEIEARTKKADQDAWRDEDCLPGELTKHG